jgi:DeoR/GlpR family transcriptional regulator of sugar metabolism
MHDLLPTVRRGIIAQRLAKGETVVATALATEFRVSEDAIRRDLRALAAEGLCERVYGGALPISPASASITQRIKEGAPRKRALAKAASRLIQPGEFVFLDNGSTNLALAHELPAEHGLTIATNSLSIATVLAGRPDIRLLMVGGLVSAAIGGCIGADATEAVRRLNIDRCFVGACAISLDGGVAAFDPVDSIFKEALISASTKTMLMVTTEKLETRAPFLFASLDRISSLVLEYDAPKEILQDLIGLKVDTRIAQAPI